MKVKSLAPHFQIELTNDGRMDAMTVHVEATMDNSDENSKEASAKLLTNHIKDIVGVSTKVIVNAPGGIERSMGKAVRVKDNRKSR